MTSLRDSFLTSYKAYKRYTSDVCRWLISASRNPEEPDKTTAKATPVITGGRLKGKDRKLAKASANSPDTKIPKPQVDDRPVYVDQLVEMADKISKDPVAMSAVPKAIISKLECAISLRRQFLQLYAIKEDSSEQDNHQHVYFMRVLEAVLELVKPKQTQTTESKPSPEAKPDNSGTANLAKTLNSFHILDVEDIDDDDEENEALPDVVLITRPSKNQANSQPARDKDDTKNESVPESLFAIYCLFKDMNRLKCLLLDHWKQYKAQEISLEVVSIISTMSIIAIQQAEAELFATFKLFPGEPPGYHQIGPLLMYACFRRTPLPDYAKAGAEREENKVTRFLFWRTASILLSLEKQAVKPPFIPLVPPGFYDISDWCADRSKLSKFHTFQLEQGTLVSIRSEACILEGSEGPRRWDDPLLSGLRDMYTNQTPVSAWLVFAADLLLAINAVLGVDGTRPWDELHEFGKKADATLNEYRSIGVQEKLPALTWQAIDQLQAQIIKRCLIEDYVAKSKAEIEQPDVFRPYHLLKSNPLLCGCLRLALDIGLHELGSEIGQHLGTVIGAAHVYNAAKHFSTTGLSVSWPDVESFIARYTPETVFAGKVPTTIEEAFKSYALITGQRPVAMPSQFTFSLPTLRKTSKGPKRWRVNTRVYQIMNDWMDKPPADPLERTKRMFLCLMRAKEDERPKTRSGGLVGQMLVVKALLEGEIQALQLDYFSLHMRSKELFLKLNLALDDYFGKFTGKAYLQCPDRVLTMPAWILVISQSQEKMSKQYLKNRREAQSGLINPCDVASEVLKNFLLEKNLGKEVALIKKV